MDCRARNWMRWLVYSGMALYGLSGLGFAAEISQRLPSGLVAHADYRQGQTGKPAVLVLHGFLTTQNFSIIRTIVSELHEQGFTVLAPTLTLGIDDRRGGLACEAIHTHTMESDLAELAWWAEWLVESHPGPLALVGHSSGSLQLIAYAASRPDTPLATVVATSPIHFGQDYSAELVNQQISSARQRIAKSPPGLDRYSLTFCDQRYVATPQSYLSYAAWDRERVLEAVGRIEVPVRIVLGSADPRATQGWLHGLSEAGAEVTVLAGASHFFDATHEFELLDIIQDALQRIGAAHEPQESS